MRTLSWAPAEGDPLAAALELLLVPIGLVGVVLEALLGKSESVGSTLRRGSVNLFQRPSVKIRSP